MEQKRRKDIAIYKANTKNTGAVAQFKLGNNEDCMFLECAKQNAPMDSARPYDWDNKIIVKLGEADICKILAYFRLFEPSAALKLFHKSPAGGNKTIEIKWQNYKGRQSYYLTVSHQKAEGGDVNRMGLPIGLDEVEYLKIGFELALKIILAWD
jgi:hypothetical protein